MGLEIILPLVHYFSCLAYLVLVFFILFRDRRSLINWVCSLFIVFLAVWSFGVIFIQNPNATYEEARFWHNFNSIGWIGFSSFYLWFTLLFADYKKILKNKFFYLFLFVAPVFFIYLQWNGFLLVDYIHNFYGWSFVWGKSIWPYLFFIYYTSIMMATIGLTYLVYKKSINSIKKKQAEVIFWGAAIAFSLGSLSNVVLPLLDFNIIPPFADTVALVWAASITYSIVKYNFLNISSSRVANEIISNMTEAVVIFDKQGKIAIVNKFLLKLLGCKKNDLLNKSIKNIFLDKSFAEKIIKKSLNEETFSNFDIVFKAGSKSKKARVSFSTSLLKDKDGEVMGTVLVARDISKIQAVEKKMIAKNIELKNSIKQLEEYQDDIKEVIVKLRKEKKVFDEERNRTKSIISHFQDPIIVLDKYNKLIFVNPRAQEIFNFHEGIIGKKYFLRNYSLENLQLISDRKYNVEEIKEKISSTENWPREEVTFTIKNKEIIFKVLSVKMKDGDEYIGSIKIFQDLTREKETDRLKTEFISIAAHQLRTPLSAIKWAIQMVISGDTGELNPEQRELLEKGYVSNEQILELVNDLLYVSRIEEGRFGYEFASANLRKILDKVLEFLDKKIKKNQQKIVVNYDENIPNMEIDKKRIEWVLQNLIDNAIKYTPEFGTINIDFEKKKNGVEFFVKDNGIGIPKDEQGQIFSKFFRASNVVKTQTRGSGLGLYIVKKIINNHGGSIIFESEEGKGTKCVIKIPFKEKKIML